MHILTHSYILKYIIFSYSYRMKCAIRDDLLQNIKFKTEDLICRGLIRAIDIQRQAMRLVSIQ